MYSPTNRAEMLLSAYISAKQIHGSGYLIKLQKCCFHQNFHPFLCFRFVKWTTSRWLPFRVVSFYNWEVYVHATGQQLERRQRVAFVILVSHECQWSGVETGFYFTKSCPEFFLIQKRPAGDFPQRFHNRADEASQ
ncbi:hypothetical protein T4B_11257 [Trichinella pseudospiralis]|uniref:Uncharacterized protein n=1 Tax=Trichinella pseudospiralis TaxID=6337 RepID=A0A0V1IA23_TRIPS|nr:hypothetical protein T4B_11257 [Trichinella pseudospiralis]